MNSKYVIVSRLFKLVPHQRHFTQGILFYNRFQEYHLTKPQRLSENMFVDIEHKLGVAEWKLR